MTYRLLIVLALSPVFSVATAEEFTFGYVDAHRIEWRFDDESLLLDLEAGYGGDDYRWVAKLEGEQENGDSDYSAQFLFSRPFSPYFDLQFGLDLSERGNGTTAGVVAGFQGMARYRVELDATLTLSEDGDVYLSGEFERDFLLTQKVVVMPRLEIGAVLTNVGTVDAGFTTVALGIRARYEVNRKFSPYVGVSWQRALGDTGRLIEFAGDDKNVTTALLGVSFWF